MVRVGILIHGGELALVVHLQQLERSGAVAHLLKTGRYRVTLTETVI